MPQPKLSSMINILHEAEDPNTPNNNTDKDTLHTHKEVVSSLWRLYRNGHVPDELTPKAKRAISTFNTSPDPEKRQDAAQEAALLVRLIGMFSMALPSVSAEDILTFTSSCWFPPPAKENIVTDYPISAFNQGQRLTLVREAINDILYRAGIKSPLLRPPDPTLFIKRQAEATVVIAQPNIGLEDSLTINAIAKSIHDDKQSF